MAGVIATAGAATCRIPKFEGPGTLNQDERVPAPEPSADAEGTEEGAAGRGPSCTAVLVPEARGAAECGGATLWETAGVGAGVGMEAGVGVGPDVDCTTPEAGLDHG
jgi:hypothetical protein